MSLKEIPLMVDPFGLVIVTVIVVVAVPPTTTVEGLNEFAIVSGSACARAARGMQDSTRKNIKSMGCIAAVPGSRLACMNVAPWVGREIGRCRYQ